MNITYTGKLELIPSQQENVEAKIAKLAKFMDGAKGERQAHVILHQHKNIHHAEITVNYLDHALISEHNDDDQFVAINSALDKLEKQVIRVREKRRDGKAGAREVRDLKDRAEAASNLPLDGGESSPVNGTPQVFRVADQDGRKPMTLEEAMMELEGDGDYVVYRDSQTDRLSVLLRRPDGHFDLIES